MAVACVIKRLSYSVDHGLTCGYHYLTLERPRQIRNWCGTAPSHKKISSFVVLIDKINLLK